MNVKYVREFIDLKQDSAGFESSRGTIFGNCKYQVLNDKIKIKATLNNIKVPSTDQLYSLHFITVKDEEAIAIKVGNIEVSKDGRGSLESTLMVDSDKGNVLKKFNVIAVIVEVDGELGKLVTPAMGYRGQKILWRNNFITYERKMEPEVVEKPMAEIEPVKPVEPIEPIEPKESTESTPLSEEKNTEDHGLRPDDMLKKFPVNFDTEEDGSNDVLEENTGVSDVLPDETGKSGVEGEEIEVPMKDDDLAPYNPFVPEEMGEDVGDTDSHDETNSEDEAEETMSDFERQLREYELKGYEVVSKEPPVVKKEIEYDVDSGKNKFLENAEEIEEENKRVLSKKEEYNKMMDESHQSSEEKPADYEQQKINRFSRKVDEMFNTYPRLTPFKESENEVWIRIEPRDVGVFPINTWKLVNNPFLMSGYFKHHHLLLGEKVADEKATYMVAVPAQYNSREKRVASAYGFTYFRTCKDISPRTGEFGYWVKQIF